MALINRSGLIRQTAGHAASGVMRQTYPARQPWSGPDVVAMRVNQTIAVRCFLASLIGLLGACFGTGESRAAGETRQPIAIQFSFDRPIDASAAPFVLASSRG